MKFTFFPIIVCFIFNFMFQLTNCDFIKNCILREPSPKTLISNEDIYQIITPKKYHFCTFIGTQNQTTYLIEKYNASHQIMEIEIADEPRDPESSNLFISVTIEEFKDNPTFINETQMETSFTRGKRIIIIDLSKIQSNSLLLTARVSKNSQLPDPPETSIINYVLKYKTAISISELPTYDFKTDLSPIRRRRRAEVTFREIFSRPEDLNNSVYNVYYLKLYHKKDVAGEETVNTIYPITDLAVLKYNVTTSHRNNTITYMVSLQDDDYDLYVTMVASFVTLDNEENMIAYDLSEMVEKPKNFEIMTPNKYHYIDLVGKDLVKTYRLEKDLNKSKYFQIEVVKEPRSITANHYYFTYAAEKYQDRATLINFYDIRKISEINNFGKMTLVAESSDTLENEIIFSVEKFKNYSNPDQDENATISCLVKFKNIGNLSDIKQYDFDKQITALRRRTYISIMFNEIFNKTSEMPNPTLYFLKIYNKKDVIDLETVNNIYSISSLPIYQVNLTGQNIGEEIFSNFDYDSNDYELYVSIVGYFELDGEETLLAYNATEITEKPKKFEKIEQNIYLTTTIKSDTQYTTFRLDKSGIKTSYFVFEIGLDDSTYNITENPFRIFLEKYIDEPTYKQDEDIKYVTSDTEYGEKTYIYQFDYPPEGSMLIHFTLQNETAQLPFTNENLEARIIFKYKTLESISNLPTYFFYDNFTCVHGKAGLLQIQLREIFNSSSQVNKSEYLAYTYKKVSVSEPKIFNESFSLGKNNIPLFYKHVIEGSNNGSLINLEYPGDSSNTNDEYYVNIYAHFFTNNLEEVYLNFGFCEIKAVSYVWVIIIVVVAFLILIVSSFFIYRYIKKRTSANQIEIEPEEKLIKVNEIN